MSWSNKSDLQRELSNIIDNVSDAAESVKRLEKEREEALGEVADLISKVEDLSEENARLQGTIDHLEKTLAETILIKGPQDESTTKPPSPNILIVGVRR